MLYDSSVSGWITGFIFYGGRVATQTDTLVTSYLSYMSFPYYTICQFIYYSIYHICRFYMYLLCISMSYIYLTIVSYLLHTIRYAQINLYPFCIVLLLHLNLPLLAFVFFKGIFIALLYYRGNLRHLRGLYGYIWAYPTPYRNKKKSNGKSPL